MRTLGFERNPFRVVPTESPDIWAGRSDLKNRVERIMQRTLTVSPSRAYLIWGDWGGGKTHTSRYFARQVNTKGGLAVYFELPRSSGKPTFADVYVEFVKTIGQANLKKASEKLYSYFENIADSRVASMTTQQASALLDELPIQGRYILKTIEKHEQKVKMGLIINSLNSFFEEKTDFALAVYYLAKGNDEQWQTSWEWINGIKNDTSEMGIFGSVESANLSSIWGLVVKMLTFGELIGEKPPYKAIFCFLDEFENIDQLDSKSKLSITEGLRDAFNHSPERFCLMIAMTTENVDEIEAVIGDPLYSRILKPLIQTIPLEKAEAKNFIKDLLTQSRFASFKAPDAFYPFAEDAIGEILSKIEEQDPSGKITPRNILVSCGTVLEMAILASMFKSGTRSKIQPDFVEKALEPI